VAGKDRDSSHVGTGEAVKLLLNYWFAYQLGKLPPRQNSPVVSRAAQTCRSVATGARVPPGELYLAQNFAAAMWVKVVTGSVALFLLQEFSALLLSGGHHRQVVANTGLLWLILTAIGLLQVAALVWRTRWTSQQLSRLASGAAVSGLLERASRPHWRDFWIMLIVAAAIAVGVYSG
jgi:hypothetical protein